jgi:arylsulfatase A
MRTNAAPMKACRLVPILPLHTPSVVARNGWAIPQAHVRCPVSFRSLLLLSPIILLLSIVANPAASLTSDVSKSALNTPTTLSLGKPNLVFILCDDLGSGDVHCFNPDHGLIRTPNFDRLAVQGMKFTDAHSSSAVCTPTRYGIMTGRYNWRTRLQSGVLGGFGQPLIAPDRLTVPRLLKQHGYATAAIGKWHLGLTWPRKPGQDPAEADLDNAKKAKPLTSIDWTKPIQNAPITLGFDSFFGISASLDMPPFAFIRNDRITQVPTTEKKWVRTGPAAVDFEAVDVLPALTSEAIAVIKSHAGEAKAGRPFFLYLALNSPHTPVVPAKEWQGRSGLGDYADFVMQTDDAVGQVLATLDATGLADSTLVIATSDNGFSPAGDPKNLLRAQGHQPSAQYRGTKADIWDGGHRIPFIARWPGRVKAGAVNDQLICLNDFMATCADLLGAKLPDNAGEDSVSFLPALLGMAKGPIRDTLIHHSINGSFAIRQGRWKLELCPGSGGWSIPKPGSAEEKGLPPVQLYDLQAEIGEQKNLQAGHPEIVARLKAILENYIADGRSTPGAKQKNDAAVKSRTK